MSDLAVATADATLAVGGAMLVAALAAAFTLQHSLARWRALGWRVPAALALAGLAFLGAALSLPPGAAPWVVHLAILSGVALFALAVLAAWLLRARRRPLPVDSDVLLTMIEDMPLSLSLKDLDGRFQLVNRQMRAWYGREESAFVGRTLREIGLDPPTGVTASERVEERVRGTGQPASEVQVRERPADGAERRLVLTKFCVHGAQGEPIAIGTTIVDDTERWRAEHELKASEDAFRRILDSLPVAISVKDTQGRYIAVNAAYRLWYELGDEDLIGSTPDDLIRANPEARERRLAHERLTIATAEPVVREDVITTAEDAQRYVHMTKIPFRDPDGTVSGVCTAITDISQRVSVERELAVHRDRLEQLVEERTRELREAQRDLVRKERLATIGELTGTVSHELRNPLGTIRSSFYTLKRKAGTELAAYEWILTRIDRNVDRCNRIIEELLSYARARKPELQAVTLDDWLAELAREQEVPPEIELRVELASGQRARIDTHMMRQAVDNLVQNAIQALVAMEDPQRPRTLTLASHGTGREVRIEVRDTGPGIDPTIAPRIFEPLVSTRAFGVGLGLPLVRRIAEQHGGEVDVDTVPGEGTVFTIRLPEVA